MKKRSWEEWIATFEPREAEWARAKSKCKGYPRDWAIFKEWLSDRIPRYFPELKGQLDIAAADILRIRAQDMHLHRDNPARWRFEKIALAYYKSLYEDKDYASGTDRNKLTCIQSFFSYHRMALVFRRGEVEKPVYETNYYEFTLPDLEAVKKYGDLKERWIFLGGKSLGQRIGDFRRLRVDQIQPYPDEIPPVPIRIKASKKNVWAHPCLDRDASEAARDLIRSREPDDTNPYMLAGYRGEPMTDYAINTAIKRVAAVAHRANPRVFRLKKGQRLRFHNFRVFLNSALQRAGVDPDLREWIVGHELAGTKRAYTTHENREAYQLAEAFLLPPMHDSHEERLRALEDRIGREKLEELKQAGYHIIGPSGMKVLRKADRITGELPEETKETEEKRKERKVVDEESLENHLNHGWNPVMALPSGRILIEREI